MPTFADRGVSRGQRKGSPRPLDLYLLNQKPLLIYSSSSSIDLPKLTRLSGPRSNPLLLRKSGSAENRTRDLCICSQRLWPLDQRGGPHCIALRTFKPRCLRTPPTYLTTFRTFGCIHSRSHRTTARQNSGIRKVSYMQPYVSNRTHKTCYETPGSYTDIKTVCQKKKPTQPTQQGSKIHNEISDKTSSLTTF
jgi:hypothetical protein